MWYKNEKFYTRLTKSKIKIILGHNFFSDCFRPIEKMAILRVCYCGRRSHIFFIKYGTIQTTNKFLNNFLNFVFFFNFWNLIVSDIWLSQVFKLISVTSFNLILDLIFFLFRSPIGELKFYFFFCAIVKSAINTTHNLNVKFCYNLIF